MDIVSRAKAITLQPKLEWPVIDAEPASVGSLYTSYLIPLALVGAVARVIGMSLIGVSIPFVGRVRVPITSSLVSAVIGLVALLVGVYVWAIIINALAPTFGGRKDMGSALKLAIYSATPALVAGVLSILPALIFIQLIAALYGLYVLYLGFPVLMKVTHDRAAAYTAATVVSGMVLGIVFGAVVGALGVGTMGLAGGFGGNRVASDAAAQQTGQNIVAGMLGAAGGGTDDSRKAAAALVAGAVAAGQQAEAAQRAGAVATPVSTAAPADAQVATASAGAAVAALGAMMNGGKPAVDPVGFQTLKAMLPASVGSLARTNATGEKSNVAGVSTSNAEGTYAGGNGGNVSVKISDMGNVSGVMAIGRMAFAVESENDGGFEKNVMLNGQKVHEKWTAAGQSSELTAFVGDRFMVEVRGTGVDLATAERAISSMDLSKLAGAR